MSTTIDQRVVEMKFDNKHFESNVSTTMSTLGKLKESLNLKGATKGFENIDDASKKVNMSSLGNSIEAVRSKFSALEVMGVTALANITNSAVDAGKKMISALTIDPIKTGFQEYETQIGAVQTILANTSHQGTNLQQVNAALDELNTYADKTIYNFTEMTRNIGTFTAAGLDLRTSVDSIKGIANLAAVSGSTSQQASTAMYQLSQALAAGKVSLMDWNSVVNAGMGGKVFQDALVRTAAALEGSSKNVEKWRKDNVDSFGSFRDSLTKGGWLTTEVLTETLKQFAGAYSEADLVAQGFTKSQAKEIAEMAKTAEDAATKVKTFTQLWDTLQESAQSGWTTSWEILVGDFEEAKATLTEMSNVLGEMIGKSAESRNKVLSEGLSSGWKQLLGQGIADEAGYIESIQEVAKKNGDAFEKMVNDSDSFSEALKKGLQEGVISSDTLSEGVFKLQEKMSGMSAEERKAAGYTNEMLVEIEALSSGLKDGSISMDEFVEKILRPSGRENIIEALWNSFEGLMSVINPIKEAFRDIFPAITGEQLYDFTEKLKAFTEKLTLSEETSEKLKSTFKGVFAVIDIVKEAFLAVGEAISPLFGGISNLGGGILDVTASFGDWLVNLRDSIKETNLFGNAAEKVSGALTIVVEKVSSFASKVKEGFIIAIDAVKSFIHNVKENFEFPGFELLHNFLERVHERMSQVGEAVGNLKLGVVDAFQIMGDAVANSKIVQALEAIWDVIKIVGSGIASAFGSLAGGLVDKLGKGDFQGIFDAINSLIAGGIGLSIIKFIDGIKEPFDGLGGILDGVVDILDGVKGSLEAWQTQLKAGALLKIASAIAILAASILVVSLIDSEKLNESLGAITILFADLMGSMAIFSKISGNMKGVVGASAAMIAVSMSVLILASALKTVGSLNMEQMATGLIGVIGLTATMVAAAKIMGSGGETIIKGAAQMIIFAAAIKVLASACSDLSSLSWEELAKGLVGVGVLMGEVALFLNASKNTKQSILTATGIVILASAIKILASACADFGEMSWEEIGKGLASIGALLLEIALFTKLTGNSKHVLSTSVGLIAIAAAMKIFASAMADFSSMSWEEIGKGLTAMGGALAEVAIAINFMPKNMISIGVGLIAVGAALEIVADVLKKMGGMTWEEIGKGLVTLGVALAELAIGLNLMNGTLAGSAALVIATVALLALTPVLSILGAMSWEAIAKGLVTIAGAFAIIGVAGLLLGPIVPSILGLAGAFALIGVGVIAAGVGLTALAAGVGALATALAAGATGIVAGLTVIITGVANLIPMIAGKIGEAILAICGVIIDGAPAIGDAVKALVLALVDVLVECIPAIAEGVVSLISEILVVIAEYTPKIVDSLLKFVIGILQSLADNLPDLIQVAVDVIMAFFSGVVDALSGIDVDTLIKGIAGVGLMAGIMLALSAVAALVPGAMIGVLGMGAVIAELALVLAAIGALAQIPGLNWLIEEGGDLLKNIGNAIGGFIGGIVGGIAEGITASLPQMGTDLSTFMANLQPFIEGAKGINDEVIGGVKSLAEVVLTLTAANILEGLTSWFTGGSSLEEFGSQLAGLGTNLNAFVTNLGTFDEAQVMSVTCAANAIKAIAEAAETIPNEGGWAAKIFGDNGIGAFSTQLPIVGMSLRMFAEGLGTFDDAKIATINCACQAIKAIAEAADTIPNEGGWAAKIFGDNGIAQFSTQLPIVGMSLRLFVDSLGTFDDDKINTVNCACEAIKTLAQAANSIDGQSEWAKSLFGDNSLATFASSMPDVGTNLGQFASNLGEFSPDTVATVECAANAIKTMAQAAQSIDGQSEWAKVLFGDNSLSTFGEEMASLGTSLSSFVKNLGTFSNDQVTTVKSAIEAVKAFTGLADADLSGAKKNLSGFGDKLVGFATDISSFTSGMPSGESIDSAIKNLEKILDAIDAVAAADASVLGNFTESLKNVGKDGVKAFVEAFTSSSAKTDVKKAAADLITQAVKGVESKEKKLKTAFKDATKDSVDSVEDYYDDFYDAGKYLVKGFAAGISENTYQAEAKAAAMAKAAKEAAEEALGIESPSKVFYGIGGFAGQGFVNALSDYARVSYKAGSEMATASKEGLRDTINNIGEVLSSDIDPNPTIRPVLDLSGVKAGAKSIGSMLDVTPSVGLSANISAINSMMARRNQNGVNDDVVAAINKLRNGLDNVGNTSYTIEGITYDDGSNIADAVRTLVRAAKVERRN